MEGVEKRHGTRDAQASVGASVLPPLLTLHDPVAVRSRRAHVARARLATAVRRHGDERRERTESSCAFRLRKRRKKVRESTKDDVTFSFDLYSLSLVSNTDFSTMLLHAQARPLCARTNLTGHCSSRNTPRRARARARARGAEQESAVNDGAQASTSRRHLLSLASGAAAVATLFSSFPLPSPALAAAETPASSAITPPATVFVAGATGETGKRTVAALVAAGYSVRAGVRDRAKAEALLLPSSGSSPRKIEIVDLDLETMTVEQLARAIGDEAAAVVCCVGSRPSSPLDKKTAAAVDEVGTINLIKAAKSNQNVSKFVLLSSILTNGKAIGQGSNPAFIFLELFSGGVLSRKLAAEKALRSAGFASWSVVRPGGLASKSPEELGAGGIFLSGEDSVFGETEEHGAAVSRDAVAEVLVAAVRAAGSFGGGKVVEVVASKGVPTRLSAEELDRAWAAV